jgi:hypothetical protein
MLQGSATTALMTREVERLANVSGFAVRRLTFDLRRPVGLRTFGVQTEMLRDGRKAKTMQVRLLDGETETGTCKRCLSLGRKRGRRLQIACNLCIFFGRRHAA